MTKSQLVNNLTATGLKCADMGGECFKVEANGNVVMICCNEDSAWLYRLVPCDKSAETISFITEKLKSLLMS